MAPAVVMVLALLLGGCTTAANMRRDLDVTGDLPRALGLGAFAPTCFFLCFTENRITQGDNVAEAIERGGHTPLVVHSSTVHEVNSQRKPVKPKAPPPAPPKGTKP